MRARSPKHVENIRTSIDTWRKVSDRLFSVGKFGVGLDGILTLIPAVGGVYGLGVGGFLLAQAWRVRASKKTLAQIAALTAADSLVGEVPIVGDAFDFLFRAHAKSARILQAEIDKTHFVDGSRKEAEASGRMHEHHAKRVAAGKQRLVFLQD